MAFNFEQFGTGDNKPVSTGGFDFDSFGSQPTTPQAQVSQSSAPFQAKPTDTPIKAGFKATGNLPSSTINFAKSIFDMVLNPIETGKGIFDVTKGAGAKVGREILEKTPLKAKVDKVAVSTEEEKATQVFNALKDRYGSLEALQKTATEDPFAFGADVASIIAGGAGLVGKTAEVSKLVSPVAKIVTKPVGAVTKGVTGTVGGATKFGVSQATGLAPDTISQIAAKPELFTKQAIDTLNREKLGQAVKTTIDERINSMKSTGAGYQAIRENPIQVQIKPTFLDDAIKSKGFDIQDGKITSTTKSATREKADINALQGLYDNWSGKSTLTTEELLNLRSDLAQVGKYEIGSGKTSSSQALARDLRSKLNAQVRGKVPGLEELDRFYTKEAEVLKQIRKDYLTKTGEFKDGAVNKIANLTGKGKQQVLDRLENIRPGITEEIKILKAVEDIERAKDLKVGTYARAGLGIVGATTFNIPAIIAAVLSTPEIAVNLIKAYGLTRNQARKVTSVIRAMGSNVNEFKTPDAIKGFVDDFLSREGGTPNKQGGFIRIGKETPKEINLIRAGDIKGEGVGKGGLFFSDSKDAISKLNLDGRKVTNFTIKSVPDNQKYVATSQFQAVDDFLPEGRLKEYFKMLSVEGYTPEQFIGDKIGRRKFFDAFDRELSRKGIDTWTHDGKRKLMELVDSKIKQAAEKKGIKLIQYTDPDEVSFFAEAGKRNDYVVLDKSIIKSNTKSTPTLPKSKVNESVSSLNDSTLTPNQKLVLLARDNSRTDFMKLVDKNFDKVREGANNAQKQFGGLGEFYEKFGKDKTQTRSLDIEEKVTKSIKSETKNYKTFDEFVRAKTDPTYEFKSGLGIKDSDIARGTFKEAISDIGGLKNVQKGTTNILNLKKTENINTNSQRYKKVLEEVKKGERTPLIIDENMEIMDGHHRLEAYRELGLKQIPVIAPKGTSITTYTKSQLTDIWNKANKK
jgi:hypothetical protein